MTNIVHNPAYSVSTINEDDQLSLAAGSDLEDAEQDDTCSAEEGQQLNFYSEDDEQSKEDEEDSGSEVKQNT